MVSNKYKFHLNMHFKLFYKKLIYMLDIFQWVFNYNS